MFPEGRLFDFLIVGAVALIVVGPKDLPLLMRKVGQFTARIRAMAAEFRASFDELARQSELEELRREVQALKSVRPMDYAAGQLGVSGAFDEIGGHLSETQAALAQSEPRQSEPNRAEPSQPEPTQSSEIAAEPPVTPEAPTT